MNRYDSTFDRVVMEAVYTDMPITKEEVKNLDKISAIAYDIYQSGDIQYIEKGVQKLPDLYEKDPKRTVSFCKELIKRCDSVIHNLESLEEEFQHRGDYQRYKKDSYLSIIVQTIGTTIIIILSSLMQIEIPYIVGGGALYNAAFASSRNVRKAKDMNVYKEYSKLKNEDPLTVVRANIQNVKQIRRNLVMIVNADD